MLFFGQVIRFRFNLEKSVQAMAYLCHRLGKTDKAKLMKLLYLADREHFLRNGYSLTGDQLFAMQFGPVPSQSLDAINGEPFVPAERVFTELRVTNNVVEAVSDPAGLTPEELRTLDWVIATHGGKGTWRLVRETHDYPEYRENYVEGTSRPIPFESIARHHGDERRFRHGRPVISAETAQRIDCPVPPADSDL